MKELNSKTIKVFLPTGNASEVSKATITTETISVVYVDKSKIDEQKDRLDGSGCYLLTGQDENGYNAIYIGETEDLLSRLRSHKKNKEFWSGVYTIQNIAGGFEKGHLTYLEYLMLSEAKKAERFNLDNNNSGIEPKTKSESTQSEALQFFETVKVILKSLNLDVFVPIVTENQIQESTRYYFKHKDSLWSATAIFDNDKMTVLKDSKTRLEAPNNKKSKKYISFRDKLIQEGYIKDFNGKLYFVKNYTFNSPSMAAKVISLRSSNGWKEWKESSGKTLDEIYRN